VVAFKSYHPFFISGFPFLSFRPNGEIPQRIPGSVVEVKPVPLRGASHLSTDTFLTFIDVILTLIDS
jgi:hypothetical protein